MEHLYCLRDSFGLLFPIRIKNRMNKTEGKSACRASLVTFQQAHGASSLGSGIVSSSAAP